ncbi:hypothetical protein BDN70DRAFT_937655 [Pholiota conissans]|uniref:Uncharacterized protein n=1 Tax=Pholiota conissans TaxID=109636 RepID=A0A9P5YR48_9AGAR|nr:hypothetical protein BDN70DRAFT_937655 [Pholiota conissans]
MDSAPTPTRTLSSASRTAARARMRALAEAKSPSTTPPMGSDGHQSSMPLLKLEGDSFSSLPSIPSDPPYPVYSGSSQNPHRYNTPPFKPDESRKSYRASEIDDSKFDSNPISVTRSNFRLARGSNQSTYVVPEGDTPLIFRDQPIVKTTHISPHLPLHLGRNADSNHSVVRPRVILPPREIDNYAGEDNTAPYDDTPYVPGPEADNRLMCLKWLNNVTVKESEVVNQTAAEDSTRARGRQPALQFDIDRIYYMISIYNNREITLCGYNIYENVLMK